MSKKSQTDKYPNYIGFSITVPSGNGAANYKQISMPVPRLQTKNKAQVMEILWLQGRSVTYYDANVQAYNTISIYSGNPVSGDINLDDPRLLFQKSYANDTNGTLLTPATDNVLYSDDFRIDLQSKEGYGFLFAGDKLNVNLTADNPAYSSTLYCRIYYRFVEVTVQEYVGLVQSLQS